MKRIDELTEEEQKRMVRMGIVVVIVFVTTSILTFFWLLPESLSNGMKAGLSTFAVLRDSLPVVFAVNCLSGSVVCEFADSQTKKRPFRLLSVLMFLLLFGEFFLLMALFLTFFDLLFHGTSYLIQFPLLAVSISVPLLLVVANFRVQRLHTFFKKVFE
jgi:hypothetical protein